MDDRKIKLLVLICASLTMIPLGLAIGRWIKGDPKPMGELDAGEGRTLTITAQSKAMPNAELYVTVTKPRSAPGTDAQSPPVILLDAAPFAMANYMDTPPVFTLYRAADVVAVSTELYPEIVLFTMDFATGASWPVAPQPDVLDAPDLATPASLQQSLFTGTDLAVGQSALDALIAAEAAPADAVLLETGYLPLNNDRLREQHEAAQAAATE